MDLYCPKCAEPWDNDSIHDRAKELGDTYTVVSADFRVNGCEALGSEHGEGTAPPGVGVVYELLGDDMDGAASEFEDLRSLIWTDE
jgi:hypothetical protein